MEEVTVPTGASTVQPTTLRRSTPRRARTRPHEILIP